MSLHSIRARLDRLTGHVPNVPTPRMMTSEEAIREVQALVRMMEAEGCAFPDHYEPLTAEQERALVLRALEEAAIELGQAVSP
jgi:hypothetical protein